jgi:hypothetical protein
VIGLVVVAACNAKPPGAAGEPADEPAALLELGHIKPIQAVWRSGDRILSRDSSYHWVLWDVPARRAIVSGDQTFNDLAIAGGVMIAHQPRSNSIEVRSVATGAVLGTIPTVASLYYRVGIAVDGSYVWLASSAGIEAWSPTARKLFEIAGDYERASVFAAPGELRVNADPVDIHVVEAISVPAGVKKQTPFAGRFAGWFDSGDRFLTAAGSTAWVYTAEGQQIAFADLPAVGNLTGQGDHVWTFDGATLRIYRATDLTAPLQSFALVNEVPSPAGDTIALVGDQLNLITLGPTITRSTLSTIACTAFGGTSSEWALGTVDGFVFDRANALGPPAARRSLSAGTLLGLGAAPDGSAALGTASGLLQLHVDQAGVQIVRMLSLTAARIEFTADAATMVLAEQPTGGAGAITIVNVADGAIRHEFSATAGFTRFALAPSGGQLALSSSDGHVSYFDLDGKPAPAAGPDTGVILFSPDGTNVASTTTSSTGPQGLVTATTKLFRQGVLSGAIDGVGFAWLDGERLYAGQYTWVHSLNLTSVAIYDAGGNVLATLPLGRIGPSVTPVGGDLAFMSDGAVVNIMTGEVVWQDRTATLSAVLGDDVLFVRSSQLHVAAFR